MTILEPIVLIGAPGSGKTSTGMQLATILQSQHTDVDAMIEVSTGRSISDLFSLQGEEFFRKMEIEATLLALRKQGVISLGGGAVTSEPIRNALTGMTVIWLRAKLDEMLRRIGSARSRPLLADDPRVRLKDLVSARMPLYEACATHVVDTDGLTPRAVAETIVAKLGLKLNEENDQ